MKKTIQIHFLLYFSVLFLFPTFATSHKLVKNYNVHQKSAFIENKGQVSDQKGNVRHDIKYLYSAPGLKLVLKSNSFSYEVFTIEKKEKPETTFSEASGLITSAAFRDKFKETEEETIHSHRIDVSFVGANPNPEILAEERSSNYNNYYLAHTHEEDLTKVYSYNKLTYRNLYPNVDIVFYAKEEGKLKYDIVVHPGGKLEDVKLNYDGANRLTLEEGKLNINTSFGYLTEEIPLSYLQQNMHKVQINYDINNQIIRFKGKYDRNKTLIIDPVLIWSTYYGGVSSEAGNDISTDKYGNSYIIGTTQSTNNIATTGAHQTINGGVYDVLIVKFNANGVRQWGTYYGGSQREQGNGITNDSIGNIYITGWTWSSTGIATSSAHQPIFGGSSFDKGDAFVTKFNSNGVLAWGTYYGGNDGDMGNAIESDRYGNVYILGSTASYNSIASTGAHKTILKNREAFIAKFNKNGVRQWGTYVGGDQQEFSSKICIDSNSNIYITGNTGSTNGIATSGTHQSIFGGYYDAFLIKFNSNGIRQWGTYYGGKGEDYGNGIALDRNGNIYLTGVTNSDSLIATLDAHQTTFAKGIYDAFIVKFNKNGVRLWGTYYGGDNVDAGNDIIAANNDEVFVIGDTRSDSSIATLNAYQTTPSGSFIAKINTTGKVKWGTYFGGGLSGINIDNSGNLYFIGTTNTNNLTITNNAHQSIYGGNGDAYIFKFFEFLPLLYGRRYVCQSEIYSYTSNKDTGLNYNWIVDGGKLISGQGTDSITIKWETSGIGSVKVVIANSIGSKDSVMMDITIQAQPIVEFSISRDLAQPRTYTFSSNNIYQQYSWNFGDGITDIGKIVKHTYFKDSTYKIILSVIDTNGCTASSDTTINVFTLSINELQDPAFDIKLFPNPFSHTTKLEFELQQKEQVEISIYDLTGKEITTLQSGIQNKGKYSYKIESNKYQLKAGIYILKVVAGSRVITRQMMIVKE